MDNKRNIKDIEKSLLTDLKRMTNILDAHLSKIPQDASIKVAPIRADMSRILKSIKNGDVDAINEITQKHANTNR